MKDVMIVKDTSEKYYQYYGRLGDIIFSATSLDDLIHHIENDPELLSRSKLAEIVIDRDKVFYDGNFECSGPYLCLDDSTLYITANEIYVEAEPRSSEMLLVEKLLGIKLPPEVHEIHVKRNYAKVSDGKVYATANSLKKALRAYNYMKRIKVKYFPRESVRVGYDFGCLEAEDKKVFVSFSGKNALDLLITMFYNLHKYVRDDVSKIYTVDRKHTVVVGDICDGADFSSESLFDAIDNAKKLYNEKDYSYVSAVEGNLAKIYGIPVDGFFFDTEHVFSYYKGRIGYVFGCSSVDAFLREAEDLPVEEWYKSFIFEEAGKIEKILEFL